MAELITKKCAWCGKEFTIESFKREQRCCSPRCGALLREKENPREEKMSRLKEGGLCRFCGKTYEITYPNQSKTCCPDCNWAVYQGRKPVKKAAPKKSKKPELQVTPYKEILPRVNTGDDFSRQFIGKVVKI